MTRDAQDSAIPLPAITGHDSLDSTSAAAPVPDYEAALTGDIKGIRIGIPSDYRVFQQAAGERAGSSVDAQGRR